MKALAAVCCIAIASVVVFPPAASAHTQSLTAIVGEKAQGASNPQTHVAGAGQWCASITAITGSVGKWWLEIRDGSEVVGTLGDWHADSNALAGASCSSSITAGEYSATLFVRGGKRGTALTVELDHV